MNHDERFWDAAMQEAISGESPPDMLPRLLARARNPQERAASLSLASAAAPVAAQGRRAPINRTLSLIRTLGVVAMSIVLGGVTAWAMNSFTIEPPPADTAATLTAQIKQANSRLATLEETEGTLATDIAVLTIQVETRQANELKRLTREVLVASAQREETERVAAEEKRRKQHLEHAQEVQRQDADKILTSLRKDIVLNADQEVAVQKIVADWGVAVLDAIKGHYRGRRHGDPRETRDKLSELAVTAANGLRELLDPRQQLVFDKWLGRDGGALAQGSDKLSPPAVFSTWDDVEAYMEWRR